MTDLELLKFFSSPREWGHRPMLPVVRDYQLNPNTGIMIEGSLKVYHINMWSLGAGRLTDLLKDVPLSEYNSLEAVVVDGWRVD